MAFMSNRNASQAMASSDMELGATECPVCHEYYKEPKILPCAHLLCRTCLLNSMKTNKLRQCPLCHCAIVDHHNPAVRSCDDVADLLPTDDAMSEMVDNIRIFNQARVCHVHKTVNAKSFCLHCGLMLCPSCVEAHLAVPATSCHTLEDLEKLTLESLTSHRQSPCSVHPEKATELFCSTHEILICQLCAFSKHRACQEVTCISEMFEKYKQSLSEMEKELRAMEDALNRVIADMEDHLIKLEQNRKASFGEIDAACDRLLVSVESCRTHLKELVQEKSDNISADVCKRKDELNYKRGLIASHCSLFKRIQHSASCFSLVTMGPQLNKRINDLDVCKTLPLDCNPPTTLKLTINGNALSRIEMELERLGELKMYNDGNTHSTIDMELAKLGEVTLNSCSVEKQRAWRFHSNHGKDIDLTNDNMTAMIIDPRDWFGLVFSSEPMELNVLYECRVEETVQQHKSYLTRFGVVTEDPATIADQLEYGDKFQSAIISASLGNTCETLKVGGRIGVVVDAARCLHIYVDGKDEGVVCCDVQLPCWALFHMNFVLRKLTALPLTSACERQRRGLFGKKK